jgi:uncharacterized protein
MLLGKITGKITTSRFEFTIENETRKFEFVQVMHKVYEYVLCQVVEIERTDKDLAKCIVIGYKDEGFIKPIRIPFDHDAEVLRAEDGFIKEIISLASSKGAYIGRLEGKDIRVTLDLVKILTKHVAILAKSGAGKSYSVGVLIEEVLENKVPVLIIDPHGEYGTLSRANDEEKAKLKEFGLKPKGFKVVKEYGDSKINPELIPLRLNNNLSAAEITALLPGKISNTQMGLLYAALKHLDKVNFTNVLLELEKEENNSKWAIINNLEYINNLQIFDESYTSYNELVHPGRCTIINLKGIPPDVQEMIVYKLMKDLFEERKQEKIPPFFTVIEEAHNYCPERSFGETKCSKILRTVASEGRKFGLGLCVVSQRPARVDKSVLSQCTTQIILKVTNPNDLKAISNSVEGLTAESEDEIKNLAIGSALITGIVDMPLFVTIRPRLSAHGGHAAEMIDSHEENSDFFDKAKEYENLDMVPLIIPKTSEKDLKLMSGKEKVSRVLVPATMFLCQEKEEYHILMESENGEVLVDIETFKTKRLPKLETLSQTELKLLHTAFQLKEFTEIDLLKKGIWEKHEILSLMEKGYLVQQADKMMLSDLYILTQLSKAASFSKIEYKSVHYDTKIEPKISVDMMKENLSKFTKVKDSRECFILKYILY